MTEGSGYGPYAYSQTPGGPGYGGYGYPPPPPPRRRGGGVLSHLAVAVLAVAVGVGATLALYSPGSSSPAGNNVTLPGSGAVPAPGSQGGGQILTPGSGGSGGSGSGGSGGVGSAGEQSIVGKVEPGMVIMTGTLQYSGEMGYATGMVINSDGLVLTNNHVVEGSTKLSATVASTGKTYPVTVLGYDKTGDIALVKLQGASDLHTVPLGNSSSVKVGDAVVALGNAQGQGSIVPAAGQITGVNQTITASDEGGEISSETLHGMLQTNANIVQGDSGGPLADASGKVIGMDTAGDTVSMGQQAPASGFAIPINTALAVARQIAAGQASSKITIGYPPFIGIYIDGQSTSSSPRQQASQQEQGQPGNPFGGLGGNGGGFGGSAPSTPSCYSSDANLSVPQTIAPASSGTLVEGVICGSPAASAGLVGGAVITAVNGQRAGSPRHLSGILAKLKPGDDASVTWMSPGGRQTTSSIHLEAGPPQ